VREVQEVAEHLGAIWKDGTSCITADWWLRSHCHMQRHGVVRVFTEMGKRAFPAIFWPTPEINLQAFANSSILTLPRPHGWKRAFAPSAGCMNSLSLLQCSFTSSMAIFCPHTN
jgi:hypothetical protein